MTDQPASPDRRPSQILPRTARQATIDRLRQPPGRNCLDCTGLATLGAFRLLAECMRMGRDPVVELVRHFECVEATLVFLAFADHAGTCWPGSVMVLRPCCIALSPDERTMVTMVELGLAGDRPGFGALLQGFIRADRHDGLFDLAVRMGAALQKSALAKGA